MSSLRSSNPAGSTLVYSTYLGAGFFEDCYSIAVDDQGSAYVAGSTESATFPVTSPYQISKRTGADAFVTKLTPSGKTRVYSTFLGGNGEDRANAIAVDRMGNATITGYTLSSDFPSAEPLQPALWWRPGCVCRTAECHWTEPAVFHVPGWKWQRHEAARWLWIPRATPLWLVRPSPQT
jgi:hypothetical protein